MKILLSGGTGFLGVPLVRRLRALGHECLIIGRNYSHNDSLPSVDVVINLAGESIAGLWTAKKKAAILSSRLHMTDYLIEVMQMMDPKLKLFISASAIGYYGHRPGETLTEESSPDPQKRFRSVVCVEWEAAAQKAEALGIRMVVLRLSHILHPSGGFLGKLIPFYKRGFCFGFGNPQAHFPWISLEDTLRLMEWLIATDSISGPLNAATPTVTERRDFAADLAKVLGRHPRGFIPSWLLRLVLGDFSSALIEDQNVQPKKVLAAGFQFANIDLANYLKRTVNL